MINIIHTELQATGFVDYRIYSCEDVGMRILVFFDAFWQIALIKRSAYSVAIP